jgi:hypothetical protein
MMAHMKLRGFCADERSYGKFQARESQSYGGLVIRMGHCTYYEHCKHGNAECVN